MYKPKKIANITKKDTKISILGKVVDSRENSFIIEDSTGKVEVFSSEKIEKNKIVRVFCTIVEGKLEADIVQNLEGLDLNLFKKIQDLYYRVGLDV